MFLKAQAGIKDSVLGTLKVKLLVLCIVLIFTNSVYATSNCNIGIETTCTCPNGKIEVYNSYSEQLKEAINNPKSCCYNDGVQRPNVRSNAVIRLINSPIRSYVVENMIKNKEIVKKTVNVINKENQVNRVAVTKYKENIAKDTRSQLIDIFRIWFASGFQLPLPM